MITHVLHFDVFSKRPGMGNLAAGVLGAYYVEFIRAEAKPPLLVEQGQEVGRDGRVWVWAEKWDGRYHIRVGGTGCFVGEIPIDVPHN